VNREVEVRVNPRGGIGERTDIHIDAIAGERLEGAQQATVAVGMLPLYAFAGRRSLRAAGPA
jgi:hypothetical protein